MQLADDLRTRFAEEDYPVHSFPELSLASWQFKDATPAPQDDEVTPDMSGDDSGDELAAEVVQSQAPIVPYSLADITRDGCFMSEPELEQLLDRLRTKKNLILQLSLIHV